MKLSSKRLRWMWLVAPLWVFAACGIAERTVEERSEVAGAPGRLSSGGTAGVAGVAGGGGRPESNGPCRSDADCSVEGDVCVGEKTSANGTGKCSPNTPPTDCGGCATGRCVTINRYEACEDGLLGAPCTQDADCSQGKCSGLPPPSKREIDPPSVGFCGEGIPDVICTTDDDCDGHLCILLYSDSGYCSDGLPGDSCSTNSQCAPPICMLFTTTTGEAGAPALLPPEPAGRCGSGELGAPCWRDEHCLSGNCVIDGDIGRCGPAGNAGQGGTSAANTGTGGT